MMKFVAAVNHKVKPMTSSNFHDPKHIHRVTRIRKCTQRNLNMKEVNKDTRHARAEAVPISCCLNVNTHVYVAQHS